MIPDLTSDKCRVYCGSNSYYQEAMDVQTVAIAHEIAEAAINPSALEDGRGCWSGFGNEHVDICENQRYFMIFNSIK